MTKEEIYYRILEACVMLNPKDDLIWLSEDLYNIMFDTVYEDTMTIDWRVLPLSIKVGVFSRKMLGYEPRSIKYYPDTKELWKNGMLYRL